jgi:hypothetical protein
MTTAAGAMDLALSEVFAGRPRRLLPARIGCAAVTYSTGGEPSRCPATAASAADVVCRSCGPRRVFLCDPCLQEARWHIEGGWLWCAADGAPITGLHVAILLPG